MSWRTTALALSSIALAAHGVSAQASDPPRVWPDEGPFTWAPRETRPEISADDLRTHVYQLAADSMGGRAAGSRGNFVATEYVAAVFQRLGLEPAGEGDTYFQEVPAAAGEYPARNVIAKPANLSFEEAASMPLVFLTAWHMLVGLARLERDETVLVLAAGSGVGIAAVQIAKLLGATVIATASSDAKLEKARALGADHVVNYERDDFAAETRKITGKRGVNVVVEHTGETTWEKSLASLGRRGRLVTCGATSGFDGKTDLRALFGKQISIHGSYMGRLSESREVWTHIAAGRLKPVVDRTFDFAELPAALRYMESGAHFGKIVVRV